MHDKRKELLYELRNELDEIDRDICELLAERFNVCLSIAKEKRISGISLVDGKRESEVIDHVKNTVQEYSDSAASVYAEIINQSKKIQRKMLNLYLVGMPNCGKTRLAGKLGIALKRRSVDTDSLIMHQENQSIDAIFDTFGESYFRKLEHRMLTNVASIGGLVVATGGGILTEPDNLPVLKSSGITVFLDRDPERLYRAKTRNRPLIRDGEQAVRRLYSERIDQYRSCADLTVDPDADDAESQIVQFFLQKTE